MAEANQIDASQVKGEKYTGYEAPKGLGPFQCDNCKHYADAAAAAAAGACDQSTMRERSKQPRTKEGMVKVHARGCCEYIERAGRKGDEEMADDVKWAKDAFKKAHKGRLHRALGVDESQTIPAEKMSAALAGKHGRKVQEMAQAAHNVNK